MSTKEIIIQYFRDVFIEGRSKVFTALDWLGILAIFLPYQIVDLQANADLYRKVGIGIIAVSFLLANMSVYINQKKAYQELLQETTAKPARLVIEPEPFNWNSGKWKHGIVPEHINCRFWFDIRNKGLGPAILKEPILELDIPKDIFSRHLGFDWHIAGAEANRPLRFPLRIDPMSVGTRIYCQTRLLLINEGNAEFIAESLPALRRSKHILKVTYTYDGLEGKPIT